MSKNPGLDADSIGHSIHINENRLDEEWLAQPGMMQKASRRLAEAKREVGYAKSNIKVVEGETAKKIRQRPALYGLAVDKKPTKDEVADTVAIQKEVIKAHEELIEATYLLDMAAADVNAISHRKSALEDLVLLWTRDYFSTPVNKDPRAREKFQEEQDGKGRWKDRVKLRREEQDD